MRHLIALIAAVTLVGSAMAAAQQNKPPEKLVFHSKGGDVVFTHAAHLNREKGECAACHDKLWPQSSAQPLKSSDGCRTCHHAGAAAFEMKGNCAKCHPNGTSRP